MVRSDVQDGCYMRLKALYRLQLEARDFRHHDGILVRSLHLCGYGKTYVSHHHARDLVLLEDLSHEGGGCGLAVGTGYGHKGAGAVLVRQLQLSYQLFSELCDRVRGAYARAYDNPVELVLFIRILPYELVLSVRPKAQYHAVFLKTGYGLFIEILFRLGVPRVQLSLALKQACRRETGPSQPHYQDLFHLSSEVLISSATWPRPVELDPFTRTASPGLKICRTMSLTESRLSRPMVLVPVFPDRLTPLK